MDQLEQKNTTAVEHEYGASEIQVLEGLEARPEAAGHVHRLHLLQRPAPSGL